MIIQLLFLSFHEISYELQFYPITNNGPTTKPRLVKDKTQQTKQVEIENLQLDLEKYSKTLQQVITKLKCDTDAKEKRKKPPHFIDCKCQSEYVCVIEKCRKD